MRTKIVDIKSLSESQIQRMLDLMSEYYDKITEDVFRRDLADKQKIIILMSQDRKIQGFSTILEVQIQTKNQKFIALYSGDTVLNKEYWGNGALAMAFGRYLLQVKLKNPLTNVYWFLISKGYKTYLLMTNNFSVHYPRYERPTPTSYDEVMQAFYSQRFGSAYSHTEKLIRFPQNKSSYLKQNVAEISSELIKNPRVAFFAKSNPKWDEGVEFACVAKVSLWIPLRYTLKRIFKIFVK